MILYASAGLYPGYRLYDHEHLRRRTIAAVKVAVLTAFGAIVLFLVTPDGMPLVWALRHAGHVESDRVYGPDLMLSVFDAGSSKGLRHFLYGATAETLEQLQARLLAKFPQARIVGSYAPPFRNLSTREETDIADRLNRSGADIIWVGLSSPKQELWMARMRDRLEASMLIGVGAAFDFHAGLKRQAPRFIQRSGFEWAFRLLCEPRRLWRRYALVVPTFISLTAFQRLGLRKFPIEDKVFGSSVPKAAAVKV